MFVITLFMTAILVLCLVMIGHALHTVASAKYMTRRGRALQLQALYACAIVVTYIIATVFPV